MAKSEKLVGVVADADEAAVTSEELSNDGSRVAETIAGARNAMSVKRVFGKAYEVDGMKVIPVAKVMGGAGGGTGEGGNAEGTGSGSGSGFGIRAFPVGVYEIRDGEAQWKPAVDVNRAIRGGQVLAGIISVCLTLIMLRRRL